MSAFGTHRFGVAGGSPRRRRTHRGGGVAAAVAVLLGGLVTPVAVQLADPPAAVALDNGLARTPQMGWNDWNAFGCNVDAQLVEQTADAMVADGMKAAGYTYVNIDDCWLEKQRDANGNLVPDPAKFPDGISAVADYVHAKGMKLGIYNDAGTLTCAGYPGSLGHETQDAATFASWGVDYLKYDNCNNDGSTTTQQYIDRYTAMRDALKATGRPILYSICEWGVNAPWTWAPKVGNSWRTTNDISDSYSSMLGIFETNVFLYPYSHPGAWNDPDMLEVGNGGMSLTEERSEFSLWAAMDAPLIAGTDLRDLSAQDLSIYTNTAVIAVNQDRLGKAARPIGIGGHPAGSNGLWVLTKPLANGDRAVVLFNAGDAATQISTTAKAVGLPAANDYALRDLWAGRTTETAGRISADVPAHGVVMYRVSTGRPASGGPSVSLTMSGVPATATPGTPIPVTEALTNNGRRPLTRAAIELNAPDGWTVTARGSSVFGRIRTGQTVRARYVLTPPGAPNGAFETDTITGSAQYVWPGGHASTSVERQVSMTAPVQPPYLTFSSASDAPARYGQLGDDFGISGAGNDLYSGSDDYTTIYQHAVVATGSTVQTELTSTADLSGYGKTGIIVRNAMDQAYTAPEGVILFASPSGGIQMEWDNNAGEWINAVAPPNGTVPMSTPVYLRLVRDGSTYTGYYSTDASTWTLVGSASVPGQADVQDAGMFITSHVSGSPATALFHGFTVSRTARPYAGTQACDRLARLSCARRVGRRT